ncbi:MAG: lipase [Gammaproteobacteria bacterium]|nr:MAG: lipase [Gammaproteobacteria bacterium]PIE38492.1 MAG: lipase [Gammaproteobacteria bacterium]
MKHRNSFLLAPLVVALAACSDDTDYDFDASREAYEAAYYAELPPMAEFDPRSGVVPFPNNLLFGDDGTLDLPVDNPDDLSDPAVAMNQLNGFSTTAPISTAVAKPLKPETLVLGETVRLFDVTTNQGAVTGINGEVTAGVAVTQKQGQIVLLPLVPLKASTDYMVILTNGITDSEGQPLQRSTSYDLTAGQQEITINEDLERLRQATLLQLNAASGQGINPDDVALSWTFRTQSIREVLQAAENQAVNTPIVLASTGADTGNIDERLPGRGFADVYVGTMDLPYYLEQPSAENPTAAIDSYWQNAAGNPVGAIGVNGSPDFAPVKQSTVTVPVIMTVPNAGSGQHMPEGGWPITIFQHGITGNRTQMLALADAMASGGRALIAIDLPMHGLTDASNPLHAQQTVFGNDVERTFDTDLVNNESNAPGPDGTTDDSGHHFMNLRNLANAAGNLRQGVADLMSLSASLGSIQAEGVSINAGNRSLVGHSLGGIVGTTFASYDDSLKAASIVFSSGNIPYMLSGSERFAPRIEAALAANGIEAGSAEYQQFLRAAQTVVDSADPINHATQLAASSVPVNMVEVRGDAVVPNSVEGSPLAGTEALARIAGVPQVDTTTSGSNFIIFNQGDHGSILNPEASMDATVEMQKQIVTFAATAGQQLPVTTTAVIEPLPGSAE